MDIDSIKTLVELMVSNDLQRIEWHDGDKKVLLRRGGVALPPQITMASAPMAMMPPMNLPGTAVSPGVAVSGPAAAPPAAHGAEEVMIRSPMVGTFYAASEPDAPPFVNVGTTIGPETVVCLIEAMKVFNEIKAEVSGRISRVLVKNAQAVEFDQPLFAVTPN